MNKRIKLIAEQALIEFMDENEYATVILPDLLSQKFAELIVRECADIANKQFSAASGLDDRDSWTAVEIRKHFGVEE